MADWYDKYERRTPRSQPEEPFDPRRAGTFGTNPDRGIDYGREGFGDTPYSRGYDYSRGAYLDDAADEEAGDLAEEPYDKGFGMDEDPTGRPHDLWRQRGPYSGLGPRGYRRSDERIHEEACERLTRHGRVDASDIEIEVKDGEITLKGSVEDRQQKYLAEDSLESIAGMRDIHNHLRVRNPQAGWTRGEGMRRRTYGRSR